MIWFIMKPMQYNTCMYTQILIAASQFNIDYITTQKTLSLYIYNVNTLIINVPQGSTLVMHKDATSNINSGLLTTM